MVAVAVAVLPHSSLAVKVMVTTLLPLTHVVGRAVKLLVTVTLPHASLTR